MHASNASRHSFPALTLLAAALAALAVSGSTVAAADRNDGKLRIVRSLPQSEAECALAFDENIAHACRPVASGRALEMRTMSPAAAESAGLSVKIKLGKRELPVSMMRKGVLSVGLVLKTEDADALPLLSSGLIADFIDDHYVCLQALIRRDLESGDLQLHDAAPAALMRYTGERLTQTFEPLVLESLKNTRALGLFVPTDADETAVNLRTLVLIVGNPMIESTSPLKTERAYELLFIHGVPLKNDLGEEDLALHAFLTSDKRTALHRLGTFEPPLDAQGCDSVGAVRFTRYAADGLTPVDSALRSLETHSSQKYSADELKQLAAAAGAGDEWLKQPTKVLAAILKGKP